MTNWRAYERKRAALERKWKPKVFKALQQMLSSFIEGNLTNADQHFNFGAFAGVLRAIHKDAGIRMARDGKRGIQKSYSMVLRQKRAALNFNQDFANEIANRLNIAGLNLAQKISDHTKKRVLTIINFGIEQGWSIDQIVKELRVRITEINKNRAITIVRTEVGRAANEGKLLGAMSMGIMMDKIWMTAEDERVRRRPRDKADHLVMQGKRVEIDKYFTNGMYLPGDHAAPPEETVNCRCTMVFKAVRDAEGNTIPKNYFTPVRSSLQQFAEGLVAGVTIGSLLTTD